MIKNIGLWSNNTTFSSAELFTGKKAIVGDDLRLPFVRLQEACAVNDLQLCIADQENVHTLESFLFVNMPKENDFFFRYAIENDKPRDLIVWENYIWDKGNRRFDRYKDFATVFTYDDETVRQGLAEKLNYAFALPCNIEVSDKDKNNLVCMIASNHKKSKYRSLYYRRLQTIKFYEKNRSADFDLYGFHWDRGSDVFQEIPAVHRIIKRLGITKLLPRVKHSSWRGSVEHKRTTLKNYKFAYCYENTDITKGYITEKIFDVMMAGTVPVYLGHPSTKDYIPESCFINRADFATEQELFEFISTMTRNTYLGYLTAIAAFLSSEQSFEFSVDNFVAKVSGKIWV